VRIFLLLKLFETNLEEDFTDAHPEGAENLPDSDVIKITMKHLLKDIEQLFFGAKPNLCYAVLVLPLNKGLQFLLHFFELLYKEVSLHVHIEHLFAKDLLVFNEIGKLKHFLFCDRMSSWRLLLTIIKDHLLSFLIQTEYFGKIKL